MFAFRAVACAITALLWFRALPAQADAVFSLSDVAWMEGHWVMQRDGGQAEEIWMAPLDRSMVGSFRWAVPGQMHVLEFLVIEEKDGVVTFRFKHFNKDYLAWEEAPNVYRLIRVEDRTATFENVSWNGKVPQNIIYSSLATDRLIFKGESPDGEGEPLILEFNRAD